MTLGRRSSTPTMESIMNRFLPLLALGWLLTAACSDDAPEVDAPPGDASTGSGNGGRGGVVGGAGMGGDGEGGDGGDGLGGAGGAFQGTPLDGFADGGPAITISQIGNNLSGNTFNPVTGTHLVILNNNGEIHELGADFSHLRRIDLGGINAWDLEDISYLGQNGGDHEYALVNENGTLYIGAIPDDGATSLSLGGFQRITFAPPPNQSNSGPEGIAYDPATKTLWACSERAPMIVYEMQRPNGSAPVSYQDGYAVSRPFDAEAALGGLITDMSSCYFDPRTGRLLIMSEQSARILDVGLDGTVHGQLDLDGLPQYEGMTLDAAGNLVVTSEPNLLQTYLYSPE